MTKRLTAEQIEAIRQRAEKATEGPWEYNGLDAVFSETISADFDNYYVGFGINEDADADFIANARQDIPELLAEVEYLRIENEKYRQALSQIAHGDTWTAHPHDIAAWALGLERDGGDSE